MLFFHRGSVKFFLNSKQVAGAPFQDPLIIHKNSVQPNGTKIGASNISLYFKFQRSSSSNNSDMDG